MTCERYRTLLDGLDNGEMPLEMIVHARSCPSCAREEAALRAAVALYRLPDLSRSADLVPRVSALLPFMTAPRRTVSMRDWLVSGFVILASIVLVPLLGEFRDLKAAYGSGFTFPLSLALGTFVTLYAGAFVMSHLDDFSRRLKRYEAASRHRRVA
ncbi:MAG: hypothetical protein KKA67_16910 [Spirochaetes bacterium]|nr:hypothetical protein [Spirochaetota bacterium]MBU1079060.1 hypothetical protein [Spirochaetota bacterium]